MAKNKRWPGRIYSRGEEAFNAISHGLGAALAVAGCVVLIVFAAISADAANIAGASIYGASLIILYLMSTLYHSMRNPLARRVFRIFDHCTIFLLIAGTYTPMLLVTLRGTVGWTLFGVVWGAAVLGIVLNAVSLERFRRFSLICYIAMGWVVVFAMGPLLAAMAPGGVALLFAGGVCYTGGVVFYILKKYRYMHGIWHLFVLAGSILHYFCILFYVIMA